MRKKKVTCKDLEGLRRLFPEISHEEQRRYVAGRSPLVDESDPLTSVPSNGLEGGLTTSLNLGMNLGPDPRWERMEDSVGREEDPWISELAPDALPAVNALSSAGYYDGGGNGNGDGGDDWLYYGFLAYGADGSVRWYSGYSRDEFDNWEGPWYGGWGYGIGYVPPEVTIYGHYPGNYTDYPGIVDDDEWWYPENGYPGDSGDNREGYPGFYYGDAYGLEYGESSDGSDGGGSGSTGSGDSSDGITEGNHNNAVNEAYRILTEILNSDQRTNEQRWNAMENAYRTILQHKGINLFGINFIFSADRGAYAWKIDSLSRYIAVGDSFFKLSVEDSIAVLVHECIHVEEDEFLINKSTKEVDLCYYDDVPDTIKEYINNRYYDGAASEEELKYYFSIQNLAESTFYKNELNANKKEKELCPDVSSEYASERDFRIWYYQKMSEIAEEYYR